MATRKLSLRTLAVVIGCASLLPIACGGDDDSGNPTPPGTGGKGGSSGTGGSGAKGGSGGKGGSSAGGVGEEGGATTGGTTSSGGKGGSTATGGSSATGGKGGSGAKGGSGGKGGSSIGESGSAGGPEAGSGGTGGSSSLHDCTADDMVTYNCGTTAHPLNIKCFADCNPTQTDDSAYFMNHCPDGSGTVGGVTAACQPWTTTLSALGAGCKVLGPGCTLPALP